MNKTIITMLALLISAMGAMAQQPSQATEASTRIMMEEAEEVVVVPNAKIDYPKNHFTIAVSDNLPMTVGTALTAGAIAGIFSPATGQKLGSITNYGTYTLGYSRSLSRRFQLGADLSFAALRIPFVDAETNQEVSSSTAHLFYVMATGKLKYVQKKWFTFGGELSAGVATDFHGSPSLAWQIDPLSFRFGSDRAAGFLRAGVGVRGIFAAGFEYAF